MMSGRISSLCILWMALFAAFAPSASAQELLAPIGRTPIPYKGGFPKVTAQQKTNALSLPFFEDFTDYSLYPNASRWADSNVYINNTMAIRPISRGVATFDALNKDGRPYDTVNGYLPQYGDTLTVLPIDLSAYSPVDSLWLSFFYQPQGNGFAPEPEDSLILLFRKENSATWQRMWSVGGTNIQAFKQVMIAVKDTAFFTQSFRFRFISKSSIGINDDVWNLDYIRMDANRTSNDTAVNDIAFTTNPTGLLKNFTAMPYKQFLANATDETATEFRDSLKNNSPNAANINYGYVARHLSTNTTLGSGTGSIALPAYNTQSIVFNTYASTIPNPGGSVPVNFEHKWYLFDPITAAPQDNDTIVYNQIFDNYLAYDDGTAEKSYFLNLSNTLPGKTAIDFKLNVADTLRGMAIYFGQQVPTASAKPFSIAVYSQLAGVGGRNADVLLYQQDYFTPQFSTTINDFTNYKFDFPVNLPAGTFYIGTIQPAFSGADSLYIALDVNRVGGNHLYYNVLTTWQPSSINGALMMRPLLGRNIVGVGVEDAIAPPTLINTPLTVFPNPARDEIQLKNLPADIKFVNYTISDVRGRMVQQGTYEMDGRIPMNAKINAGLYFVTLEDGRGWAGRAKFLKL